jgi:hypothetical protein
VIVSLVLLKARDLGQVTDRWHTHMTVYEGQTSVLVVRFGSTVEIRLQVMAALLMYV